MFFYVCEPVSIFGTILYGKIYIQPVYLRLYYLNNEQLLKTR